MGKTSSINMSYTYGWGGNANVEGWEAAPTTDNGKWGLNAKPEGVAHALADEYVAVDGSSSNWNVGTVGWGVAKQEVSHSQSFPRNNKSNNRKGRTHRKDIEDEISGQNLYKTELCRSFEETGSCRYGTKCQFAHGREEQRPVLRHPKYKTEVCKTFTQTGTCPYGKRCRFIHGTPGSRPESQKAKPVTEGTGYSAHWPASQGVKAGVSKAATPAKAPSPGAADGLDSAFGRLSIFENITEKV